MGLQNPSTLEAKAQEETQQNVGAQEAVTESEVVEIKDECVEETEDLGIVEVRSRTGNNLREAGFVSASALLLNESKESILSPGFRSVAALAGWDDEALLLASSEETSSLGDLESLIVEDSPVRESRERKRGVRTPALAKTPASARRRNRRARTQNVDPIDLARVGTLSLEDDPVVQSTLASAQGNVMQDETCILVPENNTQPSIQKKAQPGDTKPSPDRSKKSSKSAEPSSTRSDKGSSGPACLEQLREELSCAVCLDTCFEPSTTSCGHSFCKMCLENVIEKCGPRCPKCRQSLKGDFKVCPINIVLWNTVQLLFPKEVAERIKAKKERDEALKLERMKERQNASCINQASRGTIGNNWQGHHHHHPTRGIGLSRPAYSTSTANNFRRAFQVNQESEQEVGTVANVRRRNERAERSGGSTTNSSSQEELDAALASRLQQEELMRTFRGGGRRNRGAQHSTRTVSSAAANLRAMASRAVRLRARNQ